MTCFGIALGSNEGDRLAHLRAAVTWLGALDANASRPALSRIYETDPLDCPPGAASFLNAVCEITSSLPPLEMLRLLRGFERVRGRKESYPKNAPRPLDLDLLYADQVVMSVPELTLPHPRMLARRFVLQPLDDIRPALILPGQTKTIRDLLASLGSTQPLRLHPEPVQ